MQTRFGLQGRVGVLRWLLLSLVLVLSIAIFSLSVAHSLPVPPTNNLSVQSIAAIQPDAPVGSAESFLPNPSDLEGEWIIFDEGSRSRIEVAEPLGTGGEDLLLSLRWRENAYRDFVLDKGEELPEETTFLSVSVHRFGTDEGAQEALNIFPDLLVSAGYVETQQLEAVESSRILESEADGVNVAILYVQRGSFLIRVGTSSESGNPLPYAINTGFMLLGQEPVGTSASPEPIAGSCWVSDQSSEDIAGTQFNQPPLMVIDVDNTYEAVVTSSVGVFRIALDASGQPVTTNNFVCLVRAGFYDGLSVHHVVPGYFIQTGDPTGTGTGGPGYEFPTESFVADYRRGAVAMANVRPDTNGSQFFVTVADLNGLIAPDFPIFGQVSEGMSVVARIAANEILPVDPLAQATSTARIVIENIIIEERAPLAGPVLTPTATPPLNPSPTRSSDEYEATISALETQVSLNGTPIRIELKDIFFEPNTLTIPADTDVRVLLENTGAAEHSFVSTELGINITLAARESMEITVNVAEGEYEITCDIPGHKEAGMLMTLIAL